MKKVVDFNGFKASDDLPIYLQIVDFIKREIVASRIENGDLMPSRRVVSSLIGVNPNTIQKSYRILEEEAIILSKSGAKSIIIIDEDKLNNIKEEMIKSSLIEGVKNLKHMGISKKRSFELLEKYWEETNE